MPRRSACCDGDVRGRLARPGGRGKIWANQACGSRPGRPTAGRRDGKVAWVPIVQPFTLQHGACHLSESVLSTFWPCWSIPDLLTLTLVSRSSARDAQCELFSLARLLELWGGSATVGSAPCESSACWCAYVSAAPATATEKASGGLSLCDKRVQDAHAKSVRKMLRVRLMLPEEHVLVRFFDPSARRDFFVSKVCKGASAPDLEHYEFRCFSAQSSKEVVLHLSLSMASGPLAAKFGWYPDHAGWLLGSAPWRVADALGLGSCSMFLPGDRVKVRRPLFVKKGATSLSLMLGTVLGRGHGGTYCVVFDGGCNYKWYGGAEQLMRLTEAFTDPLFEAMEKGDAVALGLALEPLKHAVVAGIECYTPAVHSKLQESLEMWLGVEHQIATA